MKDVYEVLRQKELEVSRLEKEVEALRVVALLLSEDGTPKIHDQPTLQPALNDVPQTARVAVSGDRAKRYWPLTHESA